MALPKTSGWLRLMTGAVIAILLLFLVIETTSRLYWRFTRGVPLLKPGRLVYAFYPKLQSIGWFQPEINDDKFDVLFLGGSALTNAWSSIQPILYESATWETKANIRIHNLSKPGHSSRDSLIKYRYLQHTPFDLIVFYHGLNETRANNCPPDVFADDYSQYAWYDVIAKLERHTESRYLLFPFTGDFLMTLLKERFGSGMQSRMAKPLPDWLQHGADIKTVRTFRANLEEIVTSAGERDIPVLLMTYATHVAAGYTEEAFANRELDYTLHKANIALWGELQNVRAGVAAHNAITHELADRYEHCLFVDQDALVPKEGRYYNDVCHFTSVGSAAFVRNMMPDVLRVLEKWSGAQR